MTNQRFSLKQTWAGIGTSVILAASLGGVGLIESAVALNESSQPTATTNQQLPQSLLASVPSFCGEYESTFILAETSDFWLNICGGDLPHTYIGVNKRTGASIRLPLASYSPDGQLFEARNGNVRYLISFGTAKGDVLVVLQGEREILRQFIY